MDYLATGKLNSQQLAEVVRGIAAGCRQSGCSLLGGETAEMPGFYQLGEYDLAGFCVGVVEKSKLIDGTQIEVGDVAIALASAGVHSNGFSLVRKIVESQQLSWDYAPEILGGKTIGEELIKPTRIYVRPVLELLSEGVEVRGMAHITGGGLPENLPRCLPQGRSLKINLNSWQVPPIFRWLAEAGNVTQAAMLDTFNLGVGFVLIVPAARAEFTINWFESKNISAYQIGEILKGEGNLAIEK